MSVLTVVFAAFTLLRAQGTAAGFEVASIRVNRDAGSDSNFNSLPGGRLIITNESLRELMRFAFGMKDFQITGAPGWVDSEKYDIDAKTATSNVSRDLKPAMQALMADRFALKSHMETREVTVYSLGIGKGGVKLTRHDDGAGTTARTACGHMTGRRVTATVIATMLSRQLERDVHDDTGLPGKYDFELNWTPDAGPCSEAAGGPSIFTAVQQQLGLKLDSAKGLLEFLVIDHVEKPSGN